MGQFYQIDLHNLSLNENIYVVMMKMDQIKTTAIISGLFFFFGLIAWQIVIHGVARMENFIFAVVFGVVVGVLSYFFNKSRLGKTK